MSRYRVTVYAPGTNSSERRWLQLLRNWPVVGAFLMLGALCGLGELIPPLPLIGTVAGLYAVGWWRIARRTRALRSRCRRTEAVFIAIEGGVESHGDPARVAATIRCFELLDRTAVSARLSPAQYERVWDRIYSAIPENPRVP